MVSVDVWNGPPPLVQNLYAGCNILPCEISPPFLLYGGLNNVNDLFCMPEPAQDRGFLVIDKCGVVRLYVYYLDFADDEVQQAIIDTIAAYLDPPEAPQQLTVAPVEGGLHFRWYGASPCIGGYDLFHSSNAEFTDEMFVGTYDTTAVTLPASSGMHFYRVKTVYPGITIPDDSPSREND